MWKSGHSLMKQKMNEIGSLLGGGSQRASIHWRRSITALTTRPLVALKTLEIISKSERSIAEIFDEIPKLAATPRDCAVSAG